MMVAWLICALELYALVENSGVLKGKIKTGFFGYYTNLSNVAVFIFFLGKGIGFTISPLVDLTVTLTITITFMIYHFILSPSQLKAYKEGTLGWNFFSITNMLLHYINPLLTVLYWLTYSNKNDFNWYDGLAVLIAPTLYCIYIVIRKILNIPIDKKGNIYPYDFMDIDQFGFKRVCINIGMLMLFFGSFGLLVVFLCRLL